MQSFYIRFLSSYAPKPYILFILFTNIYYGMRSWIKFRDPPWYGFICLAVTSTIWPCSKYSDTSANAWPC